MWNVLGSNEYAIISFVATGLINGKNLSLPREELPNNNQLVQYGFLLFFALLKCAGAA